MLQNYVTPAKKKSIKAKILIIWVLVSRFLFLDTEEMHFLNNAYRQSWVAFKLDYQNLFPFFFFFFCFRKIKHWCTHKVESMISYSTLIFWKEVVGRIDVIWSKDHRIDYQSFKLVSFRIPVHIITTLYALIPEIS